MQTRASAWAMGLVLTVFTSIAAAYEVTTHDRLASEATRASSADRALKAEVQLQEGTEYGIAGRTLSEWVSVGAKDEDTELRYLNHFHNPLREWFDAGFRVGIQLGFSSILWAQDRTSQWSWADARDDYRRALTAPARTDRDAAMARTMQDLGRLVHLVQDSASPAHTRNDPHIGPAVSGVHGFNYESLVQRVQLDADAQKDGPEAAFFNQLVVPLRPAAGWELLDANPLAPVPIARLIDTDLYTNGPDVTVSGVIGLAEYANANYFSEDRTFPESSGFPFPSRASVSIQDYGIVLSDGNAVTRQYYRKDRDGDTGYRLATVGFLRDYQARYQLDPARFDQKPALDEGVYRDYATRLVPRAVGYSAALLDYFFRGRLDVDLVEDPDDPSRVKVTGTNASPDRMAGGTLTLYADDAKGLRMPAQPVDPLDPALSVTADPGGAIDSARFVAPADAERFVAVYQGSLGNELAAPDQANPALGFGGAVIGKVLGGVRVEQVFNDGTEWKVRTPQGVFPLREGDKPLTWDDFQRIKWGEGDSQLLAITGFGPGQPNRFVVFDVPRKAGSADLNVTSADPGPVVKITRAQEIAFPLGLSVGTTVQLQRTVDYQQVYLAQDRIKVSVWRPSRPDIPQNDEANYPFDHFERGPLTMETLFAQAPSFATTVPVSLAVDRYQAGDNTKPNVNWSLEDAALTPDGRVITTLSFFLTSPPLAALPYVEFPMYDFTFDGPVIRRVCGTCEPVLARFYQKVRGPGGALFWALVDASNARLLASTAGPVITITSHEVQKSPDLMSNGRDNNRNVYGQEMRRRDGGPRPQTEGPFPYVASIQPWPGGNAVQEADVTFQTGESVIVAGNLRADLRSAVGVSGDPGGLMFGTVQWAVDGPPEGASPTPYQELIVVTGGPSLPQQPATTIFQFSRVPSTNGERAVLVTNAFDFRTGTGYIDSLVVWDAERGGATVPLTVENFGEVQSDLRVGGVTAEAALINAPDHAHAFLVALDAPTAVQAFDDPYGLSSFTLLAPRYLYDLETLRFFRAHPPLRQTALPARLADVGYTVWDGFHAIRLP